MKYILFILSIVRLAYSIALYLPFNERDRSIFLVTKFESTNPLFTTKNGKGYHHTFYETHLGDPIDRLVYKGYILFTDNKRRKATFRRLVNYCMMDSRILITIYGIDDITQLEAVFYIVNMKVYDLIQSSNLYLKNKESIHNKAQSITLKSIYFVMDPRITNATETTVTTENIEAQMLSTNEVTESEIDEDVRRIFSTIVLKNWEGNQTCFCGTQ